MLVVSSSYPTKLTSPSFTITQSCISIAVAARLRVFCCCKAFSKPASSTVKLFSAAINVVRSIGKPNVSNSSKAASPFITPLSLEIFTRSSIFFNPLSNVLKKASSSSFITLATKSCWANSSGKTVANCSAITGSN